MGRADSLGRGKAWAPIVCRHHRRAHHYTGVIEGTLDDAGVIEGPIVTESLYVSNNTV